MTEEEELQEEARPSLAEAVAAIKADLRDEYLQPHGKPWLVGFSGGKDSTLVLQLVIEMLLDLPPSKRTRPVHVLSNDTLVESPVVQAFVDTTLERITTALDNMNLPLVVAKTTPDPDSTFWVNLIGRGYPAPYRIFRWCTDRMKIRPTTDYIKKNVSQYGSVILLLGVRRAESSARAASVRRYDNGERLNRHNDILECYVYRPIAEMTTDDVWSYLLQKRPPWGGTHRELATLYRNAQGGECPFVTEQSDVPSCGTSSSRFGCWTCTVVDKDKSIQGFIDNGFEYLVPLAEFRNWLKDFSKDLRNRMTERRNGETGAGPFTFAARREILQRLRCVERESGRQLISQAELNTIERIWREDETRAAIGKAESILSHWEK